MYRRTHHHDPSKGETDLKVGTDRRPKQRIRQFTESFGQAFSKAYGFSRQSLKSPFAEGEMILNGVSFCELFL